MSRHRFIKKINLQDELDDEPLSDGGEEDISPEYQEQFDMAFAQARSILGSNETSGISDMQIKDAIWEFYFDVEKSVDWLLEQQSKNNAIKERTEEATLPSSLRPLSALQRLSLAQSTQQDKPSLVSLARVSQQSSNTTLKYMKPTVPTQTTSISKMSLLVQSKGARIPLDPNSGSSARSNLEDTKATSTVQSKLALKSLKSREVSIKRSSSDIEKQFPMVQETYSHPPPPNLLGSPSLFAPKRPKKTTKGVAGSKGPALSALPGTSKIASSITTKSSTTKIEPSLQSTAFTSQQELDLASLNISVDSKPVAVNEPPKAHFTDQALVDMAKLELQRKNPRINLIVIGHVDAGKSTLMGRLLYELGKIDQRARTNTVRASDKAGKSSFSWAWELDTTAEERQRGITMDIASQNFSTTHRDITILDAPGHRDFIPNMIFGASQADCALLVVDSAMGEFEAGFERGGQTKEHLLLVRSLGVTQVIVAVNKLDLVDWEISRYEKIVGDLRGFLSLAGFSPSKMNFVPVSAIDGVNLISPPSLTVLRKWYNGPTLVELLDQLGPPPRSLELPLRIPIFNVFKSQTGLSSGLAVSGRVCSGVVQVGERLKVFPGGETTIVRSIEQENSSVSWSAAGTNVDLYLSNIDQNHLNIGSVLCPLSNVVPLASKLTGQIIVFDITLPITPGTYVELFYHSRDVPATITKLLATLDRGTSAVIKNNPRVLPKHTSAKVEITIRNTSSGSELPIPVEPFKVNRELGRIVLRRGGETIAAGVILDLL